MKRRTKLKIIVIDNEKICRLIQSFTNLFFECVVDIMLMLVLQHCITTLQCIYLPFEMNERGALFKTRKGVILGYINNLIS